MIKSTVTLGKADGLSLDEGAARAAFFDDRGKVAVFNVVDDIANNKTVTLESRRPVRVVLKDTLQRYHRFPAAMAIEGFAPLSMPLYAVEGVAYIELGGVKHSVVPFVNLPWLRKKIELLT